MSMRTLPFQMEGGVRLRVIQAAYDYFFDKTLLWRSMKFQM